MSLYARTPALFVSSSLVVVLAAACSGSGTSGLSTGLGADDGGPTDAAVDAEVDTPEDAGEVGAGERDAGERDAGELDAGELDAGERDAGERDAGELDAGERDAGADASDADASDADAADADAGVPYACNLDIAVNDALVNGSFEAPLLTGAFINVQPGAEPASFGWRVYMNNVDVVRQGWSTGAGTVSGPAAAGLQYLDSVGGGGTGTGAISQAITVTPGADFVLRFAYANNPAGVDGPTGASARISVTDCENEVASVVVSHDTSSFTDLDWRLQTLRFRPLSDVAILRIETTSAVGNAGLLVDDVSVSLPQP